MPSRNPGYEYFLLDIRIRVKVVAEFQADKDKVSDVSPFMPPRALALVTHIENIEIKDNRKYFKVVDTKLLHYLNGANFEIRNNKF